MSETDAERDRRIMELEKRLGSASNRSALILLLVLLGGGLNLWLTLRPAREIRLTDGSQTAELTPYSLTLTGASGITRVSLHTIGLEGADGVPLARLVSSPGAKGFIVLRGNDVGDVFLTPEDLSKLRTSLADDAASGDHLTQPAESERGAGTPP
jgi:hypothetical protein